MDKTIKQIADELGVSKQAVYKRYKGKLYTVCAPYAHTEQGVLYLSEQAENIIKQDFFQSDRSNGAHTDAHTEPHTECSNGVSEHQQEDSIISILNRTIDTLQNQLEVKDRQIEKLTEALVAAQALHAGTIQQQIESTDPQEPERVIISQDQENLDEPNSDQVPTHKWWQKIFRK